MDEALPRSLGLPHWIKISSPEAPARCRPAVAVVESRNPDSVQGKLFRHALTPQKKCLHVGVVRLAGDLDERLVTPAAAVGSL